MGKSNSLEGGSWSSNTWWMRDETNAASGKQRAEIGKRRVALRQALLAAGLESRNRPRAVDKVVAQVSNLLYRSASSLRTVLNLQPRQRWQRSADWKSTIQLGNLRYGKG
jgi:hypothetical protein